MKLTFNGTILTPLIIGGAEGKDSDLVREGLRPSAVKAGLCWWVRAMLGGIIPDHAAVRSQEKRFFGSQDGSCPFRLISRLCDPQRVQVRNAYLCMGDGQGRHKNISRPALYPPEPSELTSDPPASLQLTFGLDRSTASGVRATIGSLWMAAMLGGFGARSRRGFGALALSPQDRETTEALHRLKLSLCLNAHTPAEQIGESLKTIRLDLAQLPVKCDSPSDPPLFPVLSPEYARIYIVWPRSGQWPDWEAAMRALRQDIYRPFKSSLRPPAIGWPRARRAGDGLSSPLILQIRRTSAETFLGVIVAFQYEYRARSTALDQYFGTEFSELKSFLEHPSKLKTFTVKEVPLG